ncbi:MAG: hypothetical protein PHU42_01355 [Patescibacteria group bacterium]|nr:hypothetical protein [Patescibacteria group bacterium]
MHMCKKCFLSLIGLLFSAKVIFIVVYWIVAGKMVVTMNNWMAPTWLFYMGIIVDAILALWAFKLVMICDCECKTTKKKKR